ncbi:MAG: hypothetical protein V1922_03360 [bacterium]
MANEGVKTDNRNYLSRRKFLIGAGSAAALAFLAACQQMPAVVIPTSVAPGPTAPPPKNCNTLPFTMEGDHIRVIAKEMGRDRIASLINKSKNGGQSLNQAEKDEIRDIVSLNDNGSTLLNMVNYTPQELETCASGSISEVVYKAVEGLVQRNIDVTRFVLAGAFSLSNSQDTIQGVSQLVQDQLPGIAASQKAADTQVLIATHIQQAKLLSFLSKYADFAIKGDYILYAYEALDIAARFISKLIADDTDNQTPESISYCIQQQRMIADMQASLPPIRALKTSDENIAVKNKLAVSWNEEGILANINVQLGEDIKDINGYNQKKAAVNGALIAYLQNKYGMSAQAATGYMGKMWKIMDGVKDLKLPGTQYVENYIPPEIQSAVSMSTEGKVQVKAGNATFPLPDFMNERVDNKLKWSFVRLSVMKTRGNDKGVLCAIACSKEGDRIKTNIVPLNTPLRGVGGVALSSAEGLDTKNGYSTYLEGDKLLNLPDKFEYEVAFTRKTDVPTFQKGVPARIKMQEVTAAVLQGTANMYLHTEKLAPTATEIISTQVVQTHYSSDPQRIGENTEYYVQKGGKLYPYLNALGNSYALPDGTMLLIEQDFYSRSTVNVGGVEYIRVTYLDRGRDQALLIRKKKEEVITTQSGFDIFTSGDRFRTLLLMSFIPTGGPLVTTGGVMIGFPKTLGSSFFGKIVSDPDAILSLFYVLPISVKMPMYGEASMKINTHALPFDLAFWLLAYSWEKDLARPPSMPDAVWSSMFACVQYARQTDLFQPISNKVRKSSIN